MTNDGRDRSSRTLIMCAMLAVVVLTSVPAHAAGRGKGHTTAITPPCAVVDNVVFGSGLPTDEVINFMVTDASGTGGWVLGFTPDGTWTVNVPPATGPTTYEFASRTFGPNGAKYNVFQSCSV